MPGASNVSRTINLVLNFLSGRGDSERDAILGGTAAKLWQLRA